MSKVIVVNWAFKRTVLKCLMKVSAFQMRYKWILSVIYLPTICIKRVCIWLSYKFPFKYFNIKSFEKCDAYHEKDKHVKYKNKLPCLWVAGTYARRLSTWTIHHSTKVQHSPPDRSRSSSFHGLNLAGMPQISTCGTGCRMILLNLQADLVTVLSKT